MDYRKQSRFAILLAIVAVALSIIIYVSYNNRHQEVIISAYSDLYEENYESHIFEVFPSPELYDMQAKKIKYLNIHCTASTRDLSKEWLLDFFKYTRKWTKPGYNLVVRFDGSIDTLAPYDLNGYVEWDEVTYGVKGHNSESINIAYTGGIDSYGNPMDTRTHQQKIMLHSIVEKIRCEFPWIQVVGHRDHGVPKACPSFDALTEYNSVSPNEQLFDSFEDSIGDYSD